MTAASHNHKESGNLCWNFGESRTMDGSYMARLGSLSTGPYTCLRGPVTLTRKASARSGATQVRPKPDSGELPELKWRRKKGI